MDQREFKRRIATVVSARTENEIPFDDIPGKPTLINRKTRRLKFETVELTLSDFVESVGATGHVVERKWEAKTIQRCRAH